MQLLVLTSVTMIAFAANSVLNRMALAGAHIGAADFATIRLFAGATMLGALCLLLRGELKLGGPARWVGVFALLLYIYGFSAAYNTLDAGLGALILFGMVQITMFAGGLLNREEMPVQRWIGAGMASAGLIWLLWPTGAGRIDIVHGAAMAAAGFGWGIYSLAGRKAEDALQATAANFILAAPIGFLIGWGVPEGALAITWPGVVLAVIAGAVTSGLGYALWYHVLPSLQASVAAVAQLCVPVIALAGGMVFLNEALTLKFVVASCMVLGGVAVSIAKFPARPPRG